MKKITTTILSIVFFTSSTEIHQLLKLPVMLEHFQYHRSHNHCMTFWSFLELHYAANHPLDNDEEEDEQLPFKTKEIVSHIDVSLKTPFICSGLKPYIILSQAETWHSEGIICHKSFEIFRPPKIQELL